MSTTTNDKNNTAKNNNDNSLDYMLRYIEILKQNPRSKKELVEEYGRKLRYYYVKYPNIMTKIFSYNPAALEAAK
jgi:hypothetical protein